MKAALVTGASKGIGAATAKLLKKHGFFVYLHGRNEKDLKSLESELAQENSTFVADFANPLQIAPMIADLQNRLSHHKTHLQVLINNAGILQRQNAEDARQDLWEQQFRVNILSAVQLTESLIPILKTYAPSSIVNVSSSLAFKPVPSASAYSASKAAMNHWTECLALELAPYKIRVNTVCPGLVDTPIHEFHHLPPVEKMKIKESMQSLQPLGRIGEPEEIAEAIAFLACENSRWTTGACLTVDGGISLK